MTPFTLPISCPDCGQDLALLNARATGATSLAIVVCYPCGWEWEVLSRIERHARADTPEAREKERRTEAQRRARRKRSDSALTLPLDGSMILA